MSVYLAEFLGTFFLILIGGGVVAGVVLKTSKAYNAGWNTITVSWGLAVTFSIYAIGSISGAHINPAVTLGFAFVGEFPWQKVPGYILAQILGAFSGAFSVWIFYIPHWSKTDDKAAKLSVFSTTPAIRSYLNNFVSEMIATAVLIFSLLFIGTTTFTEGLNPLVSARITALADVYDALRSRRPYKEPWSHTDAVAEIVRCSNSHFDPELVEIFIANADRFEEISSLMIPTSEQTSLAGVLS